MCVSELPLGHGVNFVTLAHFGTRVKVIAQRYKGYLNKIDAGGME